MKRLLDHSGNVTSVFHYDEMTDLATVERTQDCEPIIEHNKRLQTFNDGYSPSREFRRIASIPLVVFEGWLNDDGLTWYDYCRMDKRGQAQYRARRLMSSDWRHLRTVL